MSGEPYVNKPSRAVDAASSSGPWRLLAVITIAVVGFLVWAATNEIEEVTTGEGQVVPSQQVQVVQSFEGGILRSLNVREGEQVEAGQILMRLDETGLAASTGELRERELALLAEQARLEAEASGAEELIFPDALSQAAPLAVAAEGAVFLSRRVQLGKELDVLEDQLAQTEGELVEARAFQQKRAGMIAPLTEEQQMVRRLADRQTVPVIELLRLNSRVAELEGDIAVGEASLQRIEAAIDEKHSQIDAARTAYVVSARQRLAEVQVALAVVRESLIAAEDRLRRAALRAPVRGTVNQLALTTLGAVVQPGAVLAEIVPLDDGLEIEAAIAPQDVAFIKPGDPVSVKITAYDYLIYGALRGEVERIGVDTITDADGGAFFQVIIRTDQTSLRSDTGDLPIVPGMLARVDIQTGTRTVLQYLVNPLRRAQAEALRER